MANKRTHAEHARWMRLALSLGERTQGQTWPNPSVGCVIVKNGRVLARGWTARGGRPHAEAIALAHAGAAARGGTLYTTLEPCAHRGETPPCVDAIITAGIDHVVAALSDPDARVNGAGYARLRAAGVRVTTDVLEQQALRTHIGFITRVTQSRPMLALKLAMSFDGRIALPNGHSTWITAPQTRRYVHMLRTKFDAVLVGGGTVRTDNPMLTVRDFGDDPHLQPVRIVVSNALDIPMRALADTAREIPVWLCHSDSAPMHVRTAWQNAGAQCIVCPQRMDADAGNHAIPLLDLSKVLNALAQVGLTRILCEGGGTLAAGLLQCGLVDELIGCTAGVVIGAGGQAAFAAHPAWQSVFDLAKSNRFTLVDTFAMGTDVVHHWHRRIAGGV